VKSSFKIKLTIFYIFLIFSFIYSQQQDYSIEGITYNSDYQPLAGVSVHLKNLDTYYVTNINGYFEFNDLKPGIYSLLLEHIGYETLLIDSISISTDKKIILDPLILKEKVYSSDEIVIYSSKIKQTISEISANINVISQEQIEKLNNKNSAEVLREETGISIQKTNHGGGSANLRGLSSNQILILVDGIRLNNSTYRLGNHQYLTTVDNSMLNQIEVIKGPMSVLYGSDALGGTINLLTKQIDNFTVHNNISYSLQTRYASADEEKAVRGSFALKFRKLGFSLGTTYKNIGDLKRGANSKNNNLEKSTNGLYQSPSGFTTHDIDTKLNYAIDDNQNITVAYQYSRQFNVPRYDKYENDGYFKWLYKNQKRDLVYLKYEHFLNYSFFKSLNTTLSFHNQQEERELQKDRFSIVTNEMDKVGTIGFTFTTKSQLYANQIISGLEIYSDKVNSYRNFYNPIFSIAEKDARGKIPNNSTYTSMGIFLKNQYEVYSDFNVTAGIRYSFINTKFKYMDVSKSNYYDNDFKALTSSVGFLYNFTDAICIKSNFGQGFRAPNLSDLSKFGESKGNIYEIPNLRLKPENLNSIDLGMDLNFSKFQSSITFFYSHISNIIESQDDKYNGQSEIELNGVLYKIKSKQNVGDAFIRGTEVEINISINENLSLYGNLTSTFGHKLYKNEPIGGIPPLFGKLGFTYTMKDYDFQLYSRFADKQNRLSSDDKDDPRIPKGGTPSWLIANFRSQVNILDYLKFQFSVENIFDLNYRAHGSGINGPGRNFIVGLNINK
jgi:hemoglobin/transferrin/lactoferrin receptor protein